ncbi:hypothetical protein SANTM175S_01639 [Streptomyces antimycoticus]
MLAEVLPWIGSTLRLMPTFFSDAWSASAASTSAGWSLRATMLVEKPFGLPHCLSSSLALAGSALPPRLRMPYGS